MNRAIEATVVALSLTTERGALRLLTYWTCLLSPDPNAACSTVS
jgi:hypothetical protein